MPNSQRGSAQILGLVALFVAGGLVVSSQIPITRQYGDNVAGIQLAKGEGSGSSGSSDSKENSGDSKSSGNSSSSGSSSTGSTEVKTTTPDGTKIESQTSPTREKTEIKTASGDRVRSELRGDRIKTEVRQGTLRLEYELKDGEVRVKVKTRAGKVDDEDVDELENELEDNDLKIATAPGKLAVVSKDSGAVSKFPLSLDLVTQTLTVTTPAGEKTVAVLPDVAIKNLLASKVMTEIDSVKADGELASVNQLVELIEQDGVLVYKVQGFRIHKLLGLIPLKSEVTATVSADNGQVLNSEQSLLGRILNRLTPEES